MTKHKPGRNYGVSFTRYEEGLARRELRVISSLDINVHEGEIVSIVGSSGSGKSLLADGIFGIFVLRVLNKQTRFIIADEMTTMLDAVTQAQIWNTVLTFAK